MSPMGLRAAPSAPRRVWRALATAAPLLVLLLALAPVACSRPRSTQGGWWRPPARLTWYWQLQGAIRSGIAVAAYDVDAFETSAATVAALHREGRRAICYVDVGTAERFRPDYHLFPKSVLGRTNGWPGERWIDIRRAKVIDPIMAARFRMCREKGFDGVEPDNIEAFSNGSGFPITASEQLTFNEWVARTVHAQGLAVLQKNDGEQTAALQPYFDGALTEQCNRYRECAAFRPYLAAGEPVLNAEYGLATSTFCPADKAAGIMGARFDLALDGRRYEPCW